MITYLVGGAVRDLQLGIIPTDHDYLVTDSNEQELLSLGYQKVGKSFPIFLHPHSKDEYSLANDIKENLSTRDLTINAMAMDYEGKLIDPFNGQRDLKQKILRHVARENFIRDPIRILRTARFLSCLPDFQVAPETDQMMHQFSTMPFIAEVLPDRVFNELDRTLKTKHPFFFFNALRKWNLLEIYFPELLFNENEWNNLMDVVDRCCELTQETSVRYAVLVHMLDERQVQKLEKRFLLPTVWAEAALMTVRHLASFRKGSRLTAGEIINLFYELDLFRKHWVLEILMVVNMAIEQSSDAGEYLKKCFEEVNEVTIKDIDSNLQGKEISNAIRAQRLKRLRSRQSALKEKD